MDKSIRGFLMNLLNIPPNKDEEKYQAYIRSAKWRRRAERIKKRDHYQCRTCLENSQLEVHHRTYERLYHEHDDDLITLCSWCHEAITSSIRERRYAKRELDPVGVTRSTPIPERKNERGTSNIEVSSYRSSTPAHALRSGRRSSQ
jgi:hypothetical protein